MSENKQIFNGKSDDVRRSLSRAKEIANGNVGDSLESRLGPVLLGGGGSDAFTGLNGYIGEFLGQSMFGGEDGTLRSPNGAAGTFTGKSETEIAWSRIRACNSIYDTDGQVASIIDLMADFATEGIRFVHGNESVEKFYTTWSNKVKLRTKFRQCIIDLLNVGNVFVYKIFAKLNDADKRAMKSSTMAQHIKDKFFVKDKNGHDVLVKPKIEYDSTMRLLLEADASADKNAKLSDSDISKRVKELVTATMRAKGEKIVETQIKKGDADVIPWKYIFLNPCQMMPNESGTGWVYLMTRDEVKRLLNKVDIQFDENKGSIKVTSPGVTGTIKKSKHPTFYAEMIIDEARLSVLQYNKKDWSKWSVGMTFKALSTILFKDILRKMEIKTAKAGINTAFVWKLGDHTQGLMPELEDYERFADMLKAPASTLNIIWNSALEVDVVQPNIKEIFDVNRWAELRKEVTSQYGITQSVVTGEGGNFSSSFISVQGLLEKLQSLRDFLLEEWIMEEVYVVHNAMKFRTLPKVQFGQMSLRDKNAENTFLVNLYDRGLISDKTLYETIERDADIERDRILNDKNWSEENEVSRRGPFIKDSDQHDLDKQRLDFDKKAHKDNVAVQEKKVTQQGKNGRPPGSGGKPQTKKRKPKPKNVSRLDIEKHIKKLDTNAKNYLVAKAGVADYRSLSKEDKDGIQDLVTKAIANFESDGKDILSPSYIENVEVQNTAFIVHVANAGLSFTKDNGRTPNKSEYYGLLADCAVDWLAEND